ncbi:DUF4185 domain-containing protein [Agromyces albus]|uniref:DUF4185 domain-containing protein n=1 Tax=Agromyces albus TaxID=205332 RepID=UPI0027D9147D|nr:DUF4185 domain-containing protein [Agromyces albus]
MPDVRKRMVATAVLMASAAFLVACANDVGAMTGGAADAEFVITGVAGVERISQLTGPDSANDTGSAMVAGTDLGSMFEADGRTWFVFGDTFGERPGDAFGGTGGIWRSNVLAHSTDDDPSDGISLDGFVTDDLGWATEALPSKKVDGDEMTVIPTYGFEANGDLYLHSMSVRRWGEPGEWETNHAGLARSDDDGTTWRSLDDMVWPGGGGFQQVSVAHVGDDLYFWGIPAGRLGSVQLMKVAEREVETASAYRYFSGTDAAGRPFWSDAAEDAATVIDRATGELSVQWNPGLERWVMTTMIDNSDAALYEGITPWGPWSEPTTLITQSELPGLYAPFLSPRFISDDGRTMYFTLSQWGPYNVFWYKLDLATAG